ncbi:5-carboxymethyl-2-hydroxymuconate Delta-isomerase [Asaia prunellae]|uniref:5-carboxymethyl-2-hydroxymuconate Delta-isomerase n=1 Tax=Asaia prunellae TaxID=610245 RepID=UPI0004711648|nr:5-carboxymethyl-2-hydroxymuconate Delta-isomerase [Asaia prunellae]
MPHLSLEYSGNLDRTIDMAGLCAALGETLFKTGFFEKGAIRVRAFRAIAWAIADQQPEDAFIDMSLRIGEGRSAEDRKHIGNMLFATATDRLLSFFDTPNFALSLEVREIDSALSWKKNTIHHRFRK